MHIFTSITANYLPKAAALAHSVKRLHPEAVFHVVLSDEMPACPAATIAAFDNIINIRDLPIENLPSWIFKHRLVELCTAVKGTAFEYIADRFGAGAFIISIRTSSSSAGLTILNESSIGTAFCSLRTCVLRRPTCKRFSIMSSAA